MSGDNQLINSQRLSHLNFDFYKSKITLDDIDNLQTNLEILLVNNTKYSKNLSEAIARLQDHSKHGKNKKNFAVKRCSGSDEKQNKKMKMIDGSTKQSSSSSEIKKNLMKETDKEFSSDLIKPYEIPNRFWQSVDAYCAAVTNKNISQLEQLLKIPDDYEELMKVPDLGPHYSKWWENEDIRYQQGEGKRLHNPRSIDVSGVEQMNKITETEEEDHLPVGGLSQQIYSILIEQDVDVSIPVKVDKTLIETTNKLPTESYQPNVDISKSLLAELISHGILDESENDDNSTDEVLIEMRNLQSELEAVITANRNIQNQLFVFIKKEVRRESIKKKLEEVNKELISHYQRMQQVKQKKKNMSKKEKEAIIKCMRKHKELRAELRK